MDGSRCPGPGLQPLALTELKISRLDGSALEDDDDRDDANTRQCTDIPCLLLFLTYVGVVAYILNFARLNGNVAKLMHGIDWQGRVCGLGPDHMDKPLLYWCAADSRSVTDGICVSACPTSDATEHMCPGVAVQMQRCVNTSGGTYRPCSEMETAREYRVDILVERNVTSMTDHATIQVLNMYCIPRKNTEMLKDVILKGRLSGASETLIVALRGVYEARYFLVVVGFTTIIISFVFLYLLGVFVDAIVYFIIWTVGLGIFVVGCGFLMSAYNLKWNIFASHYPEHQRELAFGVGGGVLALWLTYTCIMACSWRAIQVTCGSIKHACRMLRALPTLTFAPMVQLLFKLVLFVGFGIGAAMVASLGRVVPAETPWDTNAGVSVSGVGRKIHLEASQWRDLMFVAFAWIWIHEVVTAMGQYAIAHAVVIYQLNRDESNRYVPLTIGYCNGVSFHLGTLAFGGFIIGVLWVLTALCAFIAKQAHNRDGSVNVAVKAACCCCTCILTLLRDIMEMTNEMAYVDTMIRGTSYTKACTNVFQMLALHPETVAIVRGMTKAVRALGTVLITSVGTFIAHWILTSPWMMNPLDEVHEMHDGSVEANALYSSTILGSTVACGVVCFGIATSFMTSFDQIVDTLAYCIFWKKECGVPYEDMFQDGGLLATERPDSEYGDDMTPLVDQDSE